jgi:diacylglycerol kinase family enzyme
MRIVVLQNAAAGTDASSGADARAREIEAAFDAAGAPADLREIEGRKISETARELARDAGADIVIAAAGGDGTQSAVAAALAGTPAAMGVLPLGTLNHFAKDLNLPLTLAAAARVIATGKPRPVDVADINGRIFVNNSSIGLYPRVVRHRDQQREQLGRGKWYAMLVAIFGIFRRFPQVRLTITANGETWHRTTPFVFVGNNEYHLNAFNLGQRSTLDGGQLCVYFANRTSRWGLLWMAIRALFGRLHQHKDFNALCATELTIESDRPLVSVALDGEVEQFKPPLHYRIRPRHLNVMLPSPPNA